MTRTVGQCHTPVLCLYPPERMPLPLRCGDSLASAAATRWAPRGELAMRSIVRLERDTEMGSSAARASARLRRMHMTVPMPHAAPPSTTSTIRVISRDDVLAGAATGEGSDAFCWAPGAGGVAVDVSHDTLSGGGGGGRVGGGGGGGGGRTGGDWRDCTDRVVDGDGGGGLGLGDSGGGGLAALAANGGVAAAAAEGAGTIAVGAGAGAALTCAVLGGGRGGGGAASRSPLRSASTSLMSAVAFRPAGPAELPVADGGPAMAATCGGGSGGLGGAGGGGGALWAAAIAR